MLKMTGRGGIMFKECGVVYICKSDIDKYWNYLQKRGFASFNRAYLKREFENYIFDIGPDEIKVIGVRNDPKRQKHVYFASIYKFYKYVVKGYME